MNWPNLIHKLDSVTPYIYISNICCSFKLSVNQGILFIFVIMVSKKIMIRNLSRHHIRIM